MQNILIRSLAVVLLLLVLPIVIALGLIAATVALILGTFLALLMGIVYVVVKVYEAGEQVRRWFKTTAGCQ